MRQFNSYTTLLASSLLIGATIGNAEILADVFTVLDKDGSLSISHTEFDNYMLEVLDDKVARERCGSAAAIFSAVGVNGTSATTLPEVTSVLFKLVECASTAVCVDTFQLQHGEELSVCTQGEDDHDDHDHGDEHDDHDHGDEHDDHDHGDEHDDHGHDDHGHDDHGHEEEQKQVIQAGNTSFTCTVQAHVDDHDDHEKLSQAEVIGHTLAGVTVVSSLALSGMIGFYFCGLTTEMTWVIELTAFASGVILGLVVLHLLPESMVLSGTGWQSSSALIAGVYTGMVHNALATQQKAKKSAGTDIKSEMSSDFSDPDAEPRKDGSNEGDDESDKIKDVENAVADTELVDQNSASILRNSLVFNIAFGDAFCNFIDGVVIASAFQIDMTSGWLVTLSVCLHELPQEYMDFFILIKAGISTKKAVLVNLASSLAAVLGAVLILGLGDSLSDFAQGLILLYGSGVLLYAVLAQLTPKLMQMKYNGKDISNKTKVISLLLTALGIVVMGLTQLFHYHPGHDHHDH